jgi:hypothetical protein
VRDEQVTASGDVRWEHGEEPFFYPYSSLLPRRLRRFASATMGRQRILLFIARLKVQSVLITGSYCLEAF